MTEQKYFDRLRPSEQRLLQEYVAADFDLPVTLKTLNISRHTFRTHMNRIVDTLGVNAGEPGKKGATLRVVMLLVREGSLQ